MSENNIPLTALIKAFELMAEDAIDQIEASVKCHRQAMTLMDSYSRLIKLGECPNGIDQSQLRLFLVSYDHIDFGEVMNWIDEVYLLDDVEYGDKP